MDELESYYYLYEYGLNMNNRLYENKKYEEIRIDWVYGAINVE